MALVSLCTCTGFPEPVLLDNAISTKISCADLYTMFFWRHFDFADDQRNVIFAPLINCHVQAELFQGYKAFNTTLNYKPGHC